jgi:predicted HD phosphohydrolase
MISTTNLSTILSAFKDRGHEEYHGEPVSQLEHAVQAATLAKFQYPDDPEFIIAAFLHDFGHLCESPNGEMDGFGKWDHESIGAQKLQSLGLSSKIIRLVANHVTAKRYLVSTDPLYFTHLSEASKITLEKQGGLLSVAEQKEFEDDPLFHLHIALRRIDEKAKETGKPTDFGWLETLIQDNC